MLSDALVLDGNGDGELRKAMNKVGGAIQRIDDPEPVGALFASRGQPALLTEEAVIGVCLLQHIEDGFFGSTIDLGDVVIEPLGLDIHQIYFFSGLGNDFTGGTGGAQRHVQHGLHGETTL